MLRKHILPMLLTCVLISCAAPQPADTPAATGTPASPAQAEEAGELLPGPEGEVAYIVDNVEGELTRDQKQAVIDAFNSSEQPFDPALLEEMEPLRTPGGAHFFLKYAKSGVETELQYIGYVEGYEHFYIRQSGGGAYRLRVQKRQAAEMNDLVYELYEQGSDMGH